MRVTIENVKEKAEKGLWDLIFRSGPEFYYRLYVTVELSNEEKYVVERKKELMNFLVATEDGRYGVLAGKLFGARWKSDPSKFGRLGELIDYDLAPKRRLICEYSKMESVNHCEERLNEGLKKFKQVIDNEAAYFEERPEKKTIEL